MPGQFLDPKNLHTDFEQRLSDHQPDLQFLYRDVRELVLSVNPYCNELLYYTHALTSVYTLSDRLKDAFCHIAVHGKHLNLGFNSGTMLDDPDGLLEGTGSKIRHISIRERADIRRAATMQMIKRAVTFAEVRIEGKAAVTGQLISKIRN